MDPNHNDRSNAGLSYYKWLSEKMEKEMNELQGAIKEAESAMITQKQNIEDMIYGKNKLLCDFHEQFRKFSQKIEFENEMEDEIEHLVKFLDELLPLHNEMNCVKSSEINIRDYVIAKYQAICSELHPAKDTLEKEVEQMQQKLNELNEWKTEWEIQDKLNSDMNYLLDLHQEKLTNLKWLIKNKVADIEQLRNEGERIQMQTNTEILEKQQTMKNGAIKIQQTYNSLKIQFTELNDIRSRIIRFKQEFEKYNKMLFKSKREATDIETQVTEKTIKLKELQEKMEVNNAKLCELEDQKKIDIEKQEKLSNILHEHRKKIADEETLLNNLLNKERLIDEKREQILTEIKIQKEKIASLDSKNTFSNEILRNENLAKDIADLTQKNSTTKRNLFKLNNELESKMEKIDELKQNLLSKNISVEDRSSDKNLLHSYLAVENEQNAISKFIDDELNVLLNKILEKQPCIQNLKEQFEELVLEGYELEHDVVEKEKLLQELVNSAKNCESSILALKQNVYQGKYVTVQDLNKQLTVLTNHTKTEQNMIEKLKEEIGVIQEMAEIGKKRRLLSPDKKQDIGSVRTPRAARPKKKAEEPKKSNEKDISQDKDIYSFT